ncbi:MAG: DNA polymerase IV [Chlamydiae bacterium]|nr:DNA polymerase IV [Chlamydiota bacterium]MBI3276688.1 DNA polymerase IV [Chlamydiota bacterium]
MPSRAIIHIDMDAYYASVEAKDHPELKGKSIIVGGNPQGRGVVCSASYEARKFGVRSAMSSAQAARICPQAIFISPHFERYEEISNQIMNIFQKYTPLVEPLSLDEAYLDVTQSPRLKTTVTDLAKEIKSEIVSQTGLTASAGVGPNKFIAKIASDYKKPNGLTVVKPKEVISFITPLPIRKMWGVGEVTERHFKSLGIQTIGQLRKFPIKKWVNEFGKSGYFFYQLSHGQDNRLVEAQTEYKSIGQETTFERDTLDMKFMKEILFELCQTVSERLSQDTIKAHTITLKVKYYDFKSITRSKTLPTSIHKAHDIMNVIQVLLPKTEAGQKEIRLLGVSLSSFDPKDSLQLLLFKDLL